MSLKVDKEINIELEPCVLAWDNKLFVGTEDGFIKTFDSDLSPGASWAAHAAQLFSLDAAEGKVYSASNDGGLKVWSAQGEKICEFPNSGGDVGDIHVYGSYVITGDDAGNVTIYEKTDIKAKYNVLEEVKALQFLHPFLFTARDLYVTVTEIKPEESKSRFLTRHTMEGRAPMRLVGDRLLVTAPGGNNLKLYHATADQEFKELHEVKVSDMIVTSLAVSGDHVWTGGWDGHVRRWKIVNNHLEATGDIDLGSCVNALASESDTVYAAVAGGKLLRIKG